MYGITRMPANIEIGYTGEKGFRTIEIDMSPWMEIMPNGVPSIVHIRPGETEADAYIAATTFTDNILRWTISAGDLGETEGTGLAQIWLEESENNTVNKRGKSVLVATIIRQALNDASETPPTAQAAWLEQMTALKVATVNAAGSAASAEADAEKWATGGTGGTASATNNAKYYSEQASDSAAAAAGSAGDATDSAEDSEAWATGKRDGVDVGSSDPAYHNNSKYYAEHTESIIEDATIEATAAAIGPATAAAVAEATADADGYSETSEAYAKGTRDGQAVTSDDPAYHNNAKYWKDQAAGEKESAEAWAKGTRGGQAVTSDDPAYHNNSEYFKDLAAAAKTEAQTAAASASAAYGTALLAPNYSTESTYAVGDHVIYSGNYYRCISAISTAEAWTAAHWSQLTVGGETSELKSALSDSNSKIIYSVDLEKRIEQTQDAIAEAVKTTITPLSAESSNKFTKVTGNSSLVSGANGGINITTNGNITSYYRIIDETCVVYFDTNHETDVTMAYGRNYTETVSVTDGIRLKCSDTVRVKADNNALPTKSSPVILYRNDVLVLTGATASTSIKVYGISDTLSYSMSDEYAAEIAALVATEIEPVQDAVDDIFEMTDAPVKISSITGITTCLQYNAEVNTNNIGFSVNNSTDGYYIVVNENTEIWFGNITGYVALFVGTNFTKRTEGSSGSFYLKCTSPVRYRSTENNLPTASNKLQVTAGSVIAFIQDHGYNNEVYGFAKAKVVKESFKDQIETNGVFIKYNSGSGVHASTENVDVCVKQDSGYVKYRFLHTQSVSKNADVWRMGYCWLCDDAFNDVTQLTTDGEWECALKLNGRSDFSGGYAHGNQIATSVVFFVGGKPVDISDYTDWTAVDELVCVEYTTLYDNEDGTTVMAYCGSEHIFDKDGLMVNQTLNWQITDTLFTCYLAMFPPLKTVTDKFYTDDDYNPRNISFGNYPGTIRTAVLYNSAGNARFEMTTDEYPEGMTGKYFQLTDNSGLAYNKMYFQICNTGSITSGTLWKSKVRYKISASISN